MHSVDLRDGQMRRGKIISMRDTQATVLEDATKRTWKVPCVSKQSYSVSNFATSTFCSAVHNEMSRAFGLRQFFQSSAGSKIARIRW